MNDTGPFEKGLREGSVQGFWFDPSRGYFHNGKFRMLNLMLGPITPERIEADKLHPEPDAVVADESRVGHENGRVFIVVPTTTDGS